MQHPKEISEYFNDRGVNVIFLLRRNMLRRLVSMLANAFDKDAKLLNGVHVSHVHSPEEVFYNFLPLNYQESMHKFLATITQIMH